MKIAYCGYDFFYACLQQLLVDRCDVYRVFTFPCDDRNNFNHYIRTICQQHSLPLHEQPVDVSIVKDLEREGCELLITAGYRYKIPDLTNSPIKGINIHPTLLPVGRGVWPLPWTILTEQAETGVTIHQLTDDYDAGDILLQQGFPVLAGERLESLSVRLQLLARELIRRLMADFDRYWRYAQPQQGNAVTWSMPDKTQRTLDWTKGVKELDRVCRAFGKFGCFAHFDDTDWVVYGLSGWEESHTYAPGSVIHKTNTEMVVAAADGLITLLYFEAAR